MGARGATPLTFYELGKGGGKVFHFAIAEAKAKSVYGAAVTLYPVEHYDNLRTFMAADGKAGFALDGDDIVSVFKDPDSPAKLVTASMLALAVEQGGRRLDCFDTMLPRAYSGEGFRAVSRTSFNDEYAPEGWSTDLFKAFNAGRPDVVFMNYDPAAPAYQPGDGKAFPSYDEAAEAQKTALSEAATAATAEKAETPASDLFSKYHDPEITVADVLRQVPGAEEAIAEAEKHIAEGVDTSAPVDKGGFVGPDGRYTEERQALHDKILREHLFSAEKIAAATPPSGTKPTMTVLGGRGGSGKTWLIGKDGPVDASHAIYINSDEIQEFLPGYNGQNAGNYHHEASDIAVQADTVARALGLSVIHDATMRSPGGTAKRVAEYKAAGYRVEGHYMFLPPQTSAKRAMERFVRGNARGGGRFVPPSYLLSSTTNEKTFDQLQPDFDRWSVHQNMGTRPVLVAKGEK